jgi:hypothetical protein
MPTNLRTERISRFSRMSRISPLRLTTLSPATDKMVVSKSALVGFCLTAFAGGVVMTLAVDRAHMRAAEAPRELEPVVLKTTPVETASAVARLAVPPAPAPAATSPAAVEALIVQLPPPSPPPEQEPVKPMKAVAPIAAPAAAARKISAAVPSLGPPPARKIPATAPARPAVPRKQTRAAESNPTEAAPDEDPVLPATTKKKWSDPFAQ